MFAIEKVRECKKARMRQIERERKSDIMCTKETDGGREDIH